VARCRNESAVRVGTACPERSRTGLSRAGDRVLAITDFACAHAFPIMVSIAKDCFGETRKPACETRALPEVRWLGPGLQLDDPVWLSGFPKRRRRDVINGNSGRGFPIENAVVSMAVKNRVDAKSIDWLF
jgi:hypothetical protein